MLCSSAAFSNCTPNCKVEINIIATIFPVANLGLISPACRDKIGDRIGRSTVDLYGEKVMAAQLPGDTWRIHHDTVKSEINRLMGDERIALKT